MFHRTYVQIKRFVKNVYFFVLFNWRAAATEVPWQSRGGVSWIWLDCASNACYPAKESCRWQFEAFVNTADLLYILRSDLCKKVFNENLGKTEDLLMTYKAMQRMILKSRIMRKWWEKEQRFTKTTKGRKMRNEALKAATVATQVNKWAEYLQQWTINQQRL